MNIDVEFTHPLLHPFGKAGENAMNLQPIFEEDRRYSPSELADIFDVSRHTIHNWSKDDRLSTRYNGQGREFIGHEVMRDVSRDELLQKRLREAHGVQNNDDYVNRLEETLEELHKDNERLEEENERLRDQSMETINKMADLVQKQDDRIRSLEESNRDLKETVENRLPEPQQDQEDSVSWFGKLLPSFS